jgi:phospholipid/cholesterol/gamma-HCH transport system substrate-binding protein
MKFRIRYADQVVGVFILLALALIVSALLFIAVNQRWFAHHTVFHSRFTSANSITVGTPISLRGFEIGKISNLKLNDDNQVDIDFYIYPEYLPKVTMNSVLELSTSPIGLGTSLIFHKGRSSQRLDEGAMVPALDSEKGKAMEIAGLIDMPKKDDTISRLLSEVDSLLSNINTVVLQLNSLESGGKTGPVRDLLDQLNGQDDAKSRGPIRSLLNGINSTVAQLNPGEGGKGRGPIRDALNGVNNTITSVNQTIDSVGPILAGVNSTIAQLNPSENGGGKGPVRDTLQQVNDLMKQIEGEVVVLKKMTEDPVGLVPRLMGDPALMTNVEAVILNLNTAMGQVQSILGGLNAEVPKLSSTITEVRGAISSAQDVMEGLKNNPLLKGGITPTPQQQAIFQSLRKEEF